MKKHIFSLPLLVSLLFPVVAFGDEQMPEKDWPFFALCMDTHDEKKRTVEEQNEMLARLGFDGVAHLWLEHLPERAASAEEHGLQFVQVYFQVDLSANPSFDPKLAEVLPCLKGKKTQLALLINGGKPSDRSLDDKAVEVIQSILDIAEPLGVPVVLYPHANAWNEKITDCVRVAEKFPDGKVGVMFNLCHWAAIDKSEHLEQVLDLAKPHLAAVTINGTDTPEEIQAGSGNWLQPLDTGSYDIAKFLEQLERIDYHGPIGLQCYGQSGDAEIHLKRSMAKWKTLVVR